MWESNPPRQLFTTNNGFEDRGAHQHPATPIRVKIITHFASFCKYYLSLCQKFAAIPWDQPISLSKPRYRRRTLLSFRVKRILSKVSSNACVYLREEPSTSRSSARVRVSCSAKCAAGRHVDAEDMSRLVRTDQSVRRYQFPAVKFFYDVKKRLQVVGNGLKFLRLRRELLQSR